MRRKSPLREAAEPSLDSPRMPRLILLLLSLMLGAGCAVLISCGGSDVPEEAQIPATNAEQMLAELDRARAAFDAGDCAEVEESAVQVQESAENLADTLDPEIKDGIDQGAARLAELATTAPECEEQTTTTTTEPERTEPTTTTTATPTTTEETTTTTTQEEPPPEEEEPDEEPAPPGQPPGPPADAGPGTGGTGAGE